MSKKVIEIATEFGYKNQDSELELYGIQTWLRKEYDFDISIFIAMQDSYEVYIHRNRFKVTDEPILVRTTYNNYKTGVYECALEVAISYCLDELKNNRVYKTLGL